MPGPSRRCAVLVAELAGRAWNQHPAPASDDGRTGGDFIANTAATVTTLRGQVVRSGASELVAAFPLADSGFTVAIRMLNAALREGFEVRAGLHLDESDGDTDAGAVDHVTAVAAKVCRMAGPGELLLTGTTLPYLCGHFRDQCVRVGQGTTGQGTAAGELYACKKQTGDETLLGEESTVNQDLADEKVLLLNRGDQEFFVTLQSEPVTIGRAPDSSIILQNSRCSRKHAVIESGNNRFILRDQSTNGTYLIDPSGECQPLHRESNVLAGNGSICFGGRSAIGDPDTLVYRVVDLQGE